MKTLAPLISRGGDNQDSCCRAAPERISQERDCLARRGKLSGADVDDVRPVTHGLGDGICELELGTRLKASGERRAEDRQNQSAATRGDTLDVTIVLAEDDAGDVRAVLGGRPLMRLA
jgi:hypothetical protein